MSFGANSTTKQGNNNLAGVSKQATDDLYPKTTAAGGNLLNVGGANVNSGTNFLNTILNGDKANTTALLNPSINAIRENSANTLNGVSTLMPRGGGRFATLYGQSFAPTTAINNMFTQGRTSAATALPQIGLQQQQQGGNLYGIGGSALNTGANASQALTQSGLQQQQITNSLWSGLGQGVLGLATLPFGGGTATNGLLGLIGGKK